MSGGEAEAGSSCTVRSHIWEGGGAGTGAGGSCTVTSHVQGSWICEEPCTVESNVSWVIGLREKTDRTENITFQVKISGIEKR